MQKTLTLTPHTHATDLLSLKPGPQSIRIDRILLREGSDTRPLNARHVLALTESIAILGLLEPLVISTKGHLLAGGHRLAAIQLLSYLDPDEREKFFRKCIPKNADGEPTEPYDNLAKRLVSIPQMTKETEILDEVPVLVVEVGKEDSDRPLAIEIAENTTRKSYTRKEIEKLAARLKAAGYRTRPGKPKKGEIAAITLLQAAVGKSRRTIDRIIKNRPAGGKDPWDNAKTTFLRITERLLMEGKGKRGADDVKLLELVAKARKAAGAKEDGSE